MKILNLYAGIGGNRKFWDKEHMGLNLDITAVELNPQIAKIYSDFFPKDKVIVADAHQYLLDHFKEFDFIWSSPPCPSHSKARFANQEQNKPIYPQMELYQEILFCKHYFDGKYCIENVIAFYEPLIRPIELAKHWFWTNFHISFIKGEGRGMGGGESIETLSKLKQFDLSNYEGIEKLRILRNCVEPKVGLHILNESQRDIQPELFRKIL